MKQKKIDQSREIARIKTREELAKHAPLPDDVWAQLTLGTFFEGGKHVFELYLPGERPTDALIISRAAVDPETGECDVELFLDRLPS